MLTLRRRHLSASPPTKEYDVAAAIAYCEALTKAHSSTFYLGSRLFPSQQRKAVSVVYAVCRSGDDTVDEASSPEQGRSQLEQWWQQVEAAYAGEIVSTQALQVALAWVLEHYDVPKNAFHELYLGLQSDLSQPHFRSMEELMLYCRRVAGVVGFMIAPIAGYQGGDKTLEQALALGKAMQLTNILRDVGEDFGRGRCYLPAELLASHQVDIARLQAGEVTQNYIKLLEQLFSLTHTLYRQGWAGIPQLHGTASIAVGVAALNYEGILRKVKQNSFDNLNKRAYLKTHERLALIPRAVYSTLMR